MRLKDWVIFLVGTVIIGALIVVTLEIHSYQATATKCPPGLYINQNCKIVGMSASEGNTTNGTRKI
jgi:hypothetical protein